VREAAVSTTPTHPYEAFLDGIQPQLAERTDWTEGSGPLPALYVSHGAPPLFEDAGWMQQLFAWAQSMPRPRAILIVSAHWEQAPLSISSTAANTPLVYDFGGFAERYYRMTYATPDATWLGSQVKALMPDHIDVHEHPSRGLDHGAWVPLKVMYPEADIPVLQLSMPTHDPEQLMDLGRRLAELRQQGVLVIGSGYMTHGLPFLTREAFLGLARPAGWSDDFDAWAREALLSKDVETLSDFHRAPGMPYAHPTVEHFTPLFVTLGASDFERSPVEMVIEGDAMGLSKRSFQVA
jgi:4,5-DOPA dioxygenase extradiol